MRSRALFALAGMSALLLSHRAQAQVLVEASTPQGNYFGLYSQLGVFASFSLSNTSTISTIDVFVRTPAATNFTGFAYSLQDAVNSPSTVFASGVFNVPIGFSQQSLSIDQSLAAGAYFLRNYVPGYAGTPITVGDVNGWNLSNGVYNTPGGTITSLYSPNPSPAFRVNSATSIVSEPNTGLLLTAGILGLTVLGEVRRRQARTH